MPSPKNTGILSGVTILEFSGLAPAPYCGVILADFGADVIKVDRANPGPEAMLLGRGKRSIVLDLKSSVGIRVIKAMIPKVDALIDPFRPGVMEKLGLSPKVLLSINPRLIYARLTGWGQTGPYAERAGHDINYLAISGALAACSRKNERPLAPVNYLADFGGGGLLCALGVVLALYERSYSNKGQVIDAAMVDGVNHMSMLIRNLLAHGLWDETPGDNLLDSGAPFYDTYECADGRFIAVGALEPQFYALFLDGLGLENENLPHPMDRDGWPVLRATFSKRFLTKPRDYWTKIFDGKDACVSPVLSFKEVENNEHMSSRNAIRSFRYADEDAEKHVAAAPRFSRTPGKNYGITPIVGQHTIEVLKEYGVDDEDIRLCDVTVAKSKL